MKPWHQSRLGPSTLGTQALRLATYNIHKGVRGVGPTKRLEIHNLGLAIEALDADVVCLQEVRAFHHKDARRFAQTSFGWPDAEQATFLAPGGYESVYRTNAVTRYGEHGNALLARWPIGESGHHDVSDHRFEQRGILHVPVKWHGVVVHVVVVHLGLAHAGRLRQALRLIQWVKREIPNDAALVIAGDFNDWGEKLDPVFAEAGLLRASHPQRGVLSTFPSRVPVFALDRAYLRGLHCIDMMVPRGRHWARMSDHLPLVMDLGLD